MKGKYIIFFFCTCFFFFTACNRTSVSDLQVTTTTNVIQESTSIHQTQRTMSENDPIEYLNKAASNSDLISYGKLGEIYRIGKFSICYEQVVLSSTLEDLNQLLNEKDKNQFINYIVNVKDYEHYFYNGINLINDEKVNYFIKVKIKNESTTDIKQYLGSTFFTKNSEGFVNCFGALEAYNKYPDLNKDAKDALFYNFKVNEEIETVLCGNMYKSVVNNNKVYLNTGFLINNYSVDKLSVGSYMIPIN
ncbi:hypothetical protein [[Clostridium] fimetarium]|uniref:Lipoprotein n=1 Tax=[Clostridium] fimetarium TaxID=99656 RepID=A0A1I0RP71_9FIRM|nr:hypothetical protein [[Clostridium] fimetarium]SEW43052.1 hypothetical protein SAMN05421659_12021 [[Clostridium] fimetarium]